MRMSSMLRAVFSAGIATFVVMTGPAASAAVDTAREPQIIVGVGSDNTYEVMNDLDQLYNESPGCAIIPTTGGSFTNYGQKCLDPGQLDYASLYSDLIETENLYHDMFVEAKPVGSGNGQNVLDKYLEGNAAATLQADFSRRSSNTTSTTIGLAGGSGHDYNLYETQFAKAGMGIWTGFTNALVATSPTYLKDDLKGVWMPNAGNDCLVNFALAAGDSIGTKLVDVTAFTDSDADGAADWNKGTMVPYSVQNGSGTGAQFDQFLRDVTSGGSVANTWGCIPAEYKDAVLGNGEHVIFENNPTGICDNKNPTGTANSDQSDAIYPYAYHRFVQNKGGVATSPCRGKMGRIDGGSNPGVAPAPVAPTTVTITDGGYVYSGPSYLYLPVPVCQVVNDNGTPSDWSDDSCTTTFATAGFDVTDPATWSLLPDKSEAILQYMHPVDGWLCKVDADHSTDPIGGSNYRLLIEKVLKADGFGQFSAGGVGGTTFAGTSKCRSNS